MSVWCPEGGFGSDWTLDWTLGGSACREPLPEESVSILREVEEPLLLAHTVRHLGDVHYGAGRAALAEPCYHEALALYRGDEHTRPLDLANAIRSLAVLKGDAGDIEAARRLWQEAHDLYGQVGVPAASPKARAHSLGCAAIRKEIES